MSERFVPENHQRRVFGMMDGWTDHGQVLPGDLDRWAGIIQEARDAVKREVAAPRRMIAHPTREGGENDGDR